MNTKLSVYADRLIEAGWLVAAICTPLFFNVYSSRVFEPDKLTLLRSITLFMAAAWVVKVVDAGVRRPDGLTWAGWLRRLITETPVVAPTLLIVGAYVIATLLSVAPRLSIFGSYQRLEGTYTTFSYITIFFLMLQGLRQRDQVERLVTIAIITSIPVTLYGVLQHLHFDPLPWLGDVSQRIASTMGNAIFVAAYLIMVTPLTLGRLLRVVTATLEAQDPPTANFVLIPFYVLILVSQLVAIVLTQSRGPWLGLMGGIFFFVLLWALGLRQRWVVLSWVGLALAGFAFLVVLNLPGTPVAGLRNLPYIGRLGRVFSQDPTGQVRILIWRGAAELVTHDPARLVIGYGPETMHVVYSPFYPPELAHIESRNASPDRSHNETWDALVTTGLIGFAAYLALFTTLFYLGLKWLGLIASPRQRNLFLALWFGGGALAAAAFVRLTEPAFFGVALPAGMMLGLFAYLVWHTLSRQAVVSDSLANPYRFLIVALYAAMIAHFIEINFGIAIAATRLYLWMYAALLVAAGYFWRQRPGLAQAIEALDLPARIPAQALETSSVPAMATARAGAIESAPRGASNRRRKAPPTTAPPSNGRSAVPRSRRLRSVPVERGWLPRDLLAISLLVGIILVVMVYDFYAPSAGITFNWHMAWLFTFSWVFATPIALSESANPPTGREWIRALGIYAAVSLVWVLPYLLLHLIAFANPTAESIGNAPVPLYVYLAISLFALAAILIKDEALPGVWIGDARGILYAALAFFLAALIWVSNVLVVSADILYKQAWVSYHQRQQYDPAIRLYDDAIRKQPDQDFYYLFKGKALLEKAENTKDQSQRDASFDQARQVLEEARALNPLNTDHSANLARLYQTWASYSRSQDERDQRLRQASDYYADAARLSPDNAVLYDQWASAYLDMGQPEKALEILTKSEAVDPQFQETYLRRMDAYATMGNMDQVMAAYRKAQELPPHTAQPNLMLGDIYRAQKDWDKAIEAYQQAVAVDPRSASAHSSLALALAQAGRRDAAIKENQEVLTLAPNDVNTHRNLALLYREAGQLNDALTEARAAAKLAPNDTGLADLVKQLDDQAGK